MTKQAVHLVNFKSDEYWSVVKIWHPSDWAYYIHKHNDKQMWEEVDPDKDVVIFANNADENKLAPYSYNLSEVM